MVLGRAMSTGMSAIDVAGSRRQDHDPVGDEDRFRDAVRDHQDRGRGSLPEAEQLEVETLARQRIEGAERLVEKQHLGLERERPRECDTLAGATRELGRARTDDRGIEANEVGESVEPLAAASGVPAGKLESGT